MSSLPFRFTVRTRVWPGPAGYERKEALAVYEVSAEWIPRNRFRNFAASPTRSICHRASATSSGFLIWLGDRRRLVKTRLDSIRTVSMKLGLLGLPGVNGTPE